MEVILARTTFHNTRQFGGYQTIEHNLQSVCKDNLTYQFFKKLNCNGAMQKIFHIGQWLWPNYSDSEGNYGTDYCLVHLNMRNWNPQEEASWRTTYLVQYRPSPLVKRWGILLCSIQWWKINTGKNCNLYGSPSIPRPFIVPGLQLFPDFFLICNHYN